jgi:uncharacterized membrane protein YfhO
LDLLSKNGEALPDHPPFPYPEILKWDETHLLIKTSANQSTGLLLQKTFLPGWKAFVNDRKFYCFRYNFLLTGVELSEGINQVELKFEPVGLRLGFFLFFLFFGVFSFSLFRRLVA